MFSQENDVFFQIALHCGVCWWSRYVTKTLFEVLIGVAHFCFCSPCVCIMNPYVVLTHVFWLSTSSANLWTAYASRTVSSTDTTQADMRKPWYSVENENEGHCWVFWDIDVVFCDVALSRLLDVISTKFDTFNWPNNRSPFYLKELVNF